MRVAYPLMSVLLLWSVASSAQMPQNLILTAEQQETTRPHLVDTWNAEFNLEALLYEPQSIVLNLPDQEGATITLKAWEFREGYILQDTDDDGDLEPVPDPDAQPDQISWRWYGESDEWQVGLTLRRGVLAGTITSSNARYSIWPRRSGAIELGKSRPGYWSSHGSNGKPQNDPHFVKAGGTAVARPPAPSTWDMTCSGPTTTANHTIDILFFYTDDVDADSAANGGAEAVIDNQVSSANQSLRNSLIYGVNYQISDIQLISGSFDDDPINDALEDFGGFSFNTTAWPWMTTTATTARNLRTSTKSDIAMLARSTTIPGDNSCGVAWINHRADDPNAYEYLPGSAEYKEIAFGVVNPNCDVDYNVAHELGHILGMEHDPLASLISTGAGGIDPSCPWAFGHKFSGTPGVASGYKFRTVMAEHAPINNASGPGPGGCGNWPFNDDESDSECARVPAYSTPAVEYNYGFLYGSLTAAPELGVMTASGSFRAARANDTLPRLAALVVNYGVRDDQIFKTNFGGTP